MVEAADPAGLLAMAVLQEPAGLASRGDLIAQCITLAVRIVAGVLLIFGSSTIGRLLANLRYDPDTIPKQQLSIAMLLVLLVLFAVVLAIIRQMA